MRGKILAIWMTSLRTSRLSAWTLIRTKFPADAVLGIQTFDGMYHEHFSQLVHDLGNLQIIGQHLNGDTEISGLSVAPTARDSML